MFLSVSAGLWKLSARTSLGVDAKTLTDWLENVTSPQGDRYTYLPPTATDRGLTFVAYTSAVLLNRPMPPSAIGLFETSLADALKPLLGQPAFVHRA